MLLDKDSLWMLSKQSYFIALCSASSEKIEFEHFMHSEFSFPIVYFDILDSDFNLNHFS